MLQKCVNTHVTIPLPVSLITSHMLLAGKIMFWTNLFCTNTFTSRSLLPLFTDLQSVMDSAWSRWHRTSQDQQLLARLIWALYTLDADTHCPDHMLFVEFQVGCRTIGIPARFVRLSRLQLS